MRTRHLSPISLLILVLVLLASMACSSGHQEPSDSVGQTHAAIQQSAGRGGLAEWSAGTGTNTMHQYVSDFTKKDPVTNPQYQSCVDNGDCQTGDPPTCWATNTCPHYRHPKDWEAAILRKAVGDIVQVIMRNGFSSDWRYSPVLPIKTTYGAIYSIPEEFFLSLIGYELDLFYEFRLDGSGPVALGRSTMMTRSIVGRLQARHLLLDRQLRIDPLLPRGLALALQRLLGR